MAGNGIEVHLGPDNTFKYYEQNYFETSTSLLHRTAPPHPLAPFLTLHHNFLEKFIV